MHSVAVTSFKPVMSVRPAQWDLILEVSARSFLDVVSVLGEPLAAAHGSVVAISSQGAARFIPGYGALAPAKAALESLVRQLACELAPRGVRVHAVHAGLIDSDVVRHFPPGVREAVVHRTPLGRLWSPGSAWSRRSAAVNPWASRRIAVRQKTKEVAMKILWLLLLALGGPCLPGPLDAQENADEQPAGPSARRFGFGVSTSSFSPDFAELGKAFTYAEDQYRNQGYSITPYSPDIAVSRLVMFTLRFRAPIPIGLLLEAGTALDDRLDFKAVSASVLYFPPVAWKSLEPYLGAGIGRYHFSTTRSYGEGNRISPLNSDGSYTYLDRIESKGGGIGSKLMIGLDLHDPSSKASLGGFLSYLVMLESVEGAMPNGPSVKIDLNSFMVGGRILINL
jgi:hypothetical protein